MNHKAFLAPLINNSPNDLFPTRKYWQSYQRSQMQVFFHHSSTLLSEPKKNMPKLQWRDRLRIKINIRQHKEVNIRFFFTHLGRMSNNVFRSGVIFKVPPHFVQVGRHFVFVSSQATLMLSLVPRPSPGPALGKLNSRFCKSPESRYKYLEIPWVTNFSSVKVK